MAVSINQALNSTSLDDSTQRALRAVFQAFLAAMQDEAASLDDDAGVTATDAATRLALLIEE
jgi:hypothetical protein